MVEQKISGQLDRVIFKSPGQGLVWLSTFLIKDFFWLKCVFDKHALRLILAVLLKKKKVFIKQSLKKYNIYF